MPLRAHAVAQGIPRTEKRRECYKPLRNKLVELSLMILQREPFQNRMKLIFDSAEEEEKTHNPGIDFFPNLRALEVEAYGCSLSKRIQKDMRRYL